MIRILSPLVLLALALPLVAEEEAHKIKLLNFPAAGKSVKATETAKITEATKVLDENGQALKDDNNVKVVKMAYTQKTIEGGDKRAKKYSREYTRAEVTSNDKTEKQGFATRTVVFTLEDKKYTAKVEGKPDLEEKDLEDLLKDANKDPEGTTRDAILPKKAVKVGETWKLEGKDIANLLKDLAVTEDGAKGTGKLAKVYKKDGKQFGVIEFVMSGPGKAGGTPGKADVALTIDVPIDGSSATGKVTSKLVYTVDNTVEQNGMKFKVQARVVVEGTSERADVVEKK